MKVIQCDLCGKQFGGGYKWSEINRLRRDSRAAGWDNDVCPDCASPVGNDPIGIETDKDH